MTLREREVANRRRNFRKQSSPAQAQVEHRDRVLPFLLWCKINGISPATGLRLLRAGDGPPIVQLSPRRIGVRESDNRAWQASRVR
jgi:predicted DNA-binding transcriptional regulator AlpA